MPADRSALDEGAGDLQAALTAAAQRVAADTGVPVPPIEGKLLRPSIARALLPPALRAAPGDDFLRGALAIQMVHEASLLHDDILDDASIRRGAPTLNASRGIGPALVLGDHWLTASYRVAAAAGSPEWLGVFIDAVERTVAGEVDQARHAGTLVPPETYESVIRRKSGALFGAAAALVACRGDVTTTVDLPSVVEFGTRLGALYQRVDDLLDYCPNAELGKPALQDWTQRKTTFLLHLAGVESFDLSDDEIHARLFHGSPSTVERAVDRLENEVRALLAEQARVFPGSDGQLGEVLRGWIDLARGRLAREGVEAGSTASTLGAARTASATERSSAEAFVVGAASSIGGPEAWPAFFGRHSKSFRFASRLFPADRRAEIEGVYAFCRFTDDLVDEAEVPVDEARARLEAWRTLARAAWEGHDTGVPLLRHAMGRMREADVPFTYADELITGVGMDLEPVYYERLKDLELYTYRVASVVGGWITELFGLRDEALLSRAFALGHAMQLTNILRDVGEDWRNGRLYLPRGLMRDHHLDPTSIEALVRTGRVQPAWVEFVESLMSVADRHYELAFEAIPELPKFYARPVAVAARVYQGIHDEIRRNGYDNGTLRAHTSLPRKLIVGVGALRELRRVRAESNGLRLSPLDA